MSLNKELPFILVILVLLISTSTVIGIEKTNFDFKPTLKTIILQPHLPIHIHGNQDFTFDNGVTGGNGTSEDPYIINGWYIISDGFSQAGVLIEETTATFTLGDCIVSGFNQSDFCAVKFIDVIYAKIINIETFDNFYGIRIDQSSDIDVINCICHDNFGQNDYHQGIDGFSVNSSSHINFVSCESFKMRNNRFPYDSANGFCFYKSSFCQVENCTSHDNHGNGISLKSSTSDIVINNCSLYDNLGSGVYAGADRIRISNCNMTGNGLIANDGAASASIKGDFNILENCTISGGYGDGVEAVFNHNTIRNCTIFDHPRKSGISIRQSQGTLVEYCTISGCEVGVSCRLAIRIRIIRNIIRNNTYGITTYFFQIGEKASLRIHYNNIVNNSNFGLQLCSWSFADARNNWWGSSQGPSRRLKYYGDGINTQGISLCIYWPWSQAPIIL